jgi:hypothetical protein
VGQRSRKLEERRRYRQNTAEILNALSDRFDLLVSACAMFDAQHFVQAKRLAVDLRVLLHHTKASTSILGQLESKDAMLFEDSCGPLSPKLIGSSGALCMPSMSTGWNDSWIPIYERRYLTGPLEPKQFEPWWTAPLLRDNRQRTYSRKQMVLGIANQDGGAHVDPELDEDYAELSRNNSAGHETSTSPHGPWIAAGSPVPASVRQIAHEVVRSCQWWLGPVLTATRRVTEEQAAVAVAPLDAYVGLDEDELAGRDPGQLEQAPTS